GGGVEIRLAGEDSPHRLRAAPVGRRRRNGEKGVIAIEHFVPRFAERSPARLLNLQRGGTERVAHAFSQPHRAEWSRRGIRYAKSPRPTGSPDGPVLCLVEHQIDGEGRGGDQCAKRV